MTATSGAGHARAVDLAIELARPWHGAIELIAVRRPESDLAEVAAARARVTAAGLRSTVAVLEGNEAGAAR
jgi:hypothetical protein